MARVRGETRASLSLARHTQNPRDKDRDTVSGQPRGRREEGGGGLERPGRGESRRTSLGRPSSPRGVPAITPPPAGLVLAGTLRARCGGHCELPRERGPQGQAPSALPASSSCLHPRPTAAQRAPRAQGEASGHRLGGCESKSGPQDPHALKFHETGGEWWNTTWVMNSTLES